MRGVGHCSPHQSSIGKGCGVRIYVGNLAYTATGDELKDAFAAHGEVKEVYIPTDRETGRSRGFAFVEMPSEDEGRAAVEALDGAEVGGRALKVNEARPRENRGGGGGGGGGGRGGGYDRGW